MNLNYEKIKSRIEHGGNAWTSYSDLFLVLSVIFLLLYVVSSLRTSTATIVTAQAFRKTVEENETLRKQVAAYEVTKDEYLQRGASADQLAMYQQMTKRLDLLGEDTKDERQRLERETRDLTEKEKALNQYQQMMKSMINANMIAQGRMRLRDLKIEERDQRLEEKNRNIHALSQALSERQGELARKEQEIAQNNQRIDSIKAKLDQSIKEINYAYRSKKKSQEAMQREVERLKADSNTQIAALQDKNASNEKQLEASKRSLEESKKNLESKNKEIAGLIGTLHDKEKDFSEALERAKADRQAQIASMKQERERFERTLASEKLGAEEKVRREKAYAAKVEAERKAADDRLRRAQADLDGTRKDLGALERSNATLKNDLKATLSKQAERRLLAERIAAGLAKAGIKADVNRDSGEVTVTFLEEYFEYGKAELKPAMRTKLERFFPAYATALFESNAVAAHIANVDIIGFASPTFRGKFVDPESLSPGDRAAVNFNMDLSFQRAKSIFAFVFDTTKLQFAHQKELLPLVRVTGRSYLAERKAAASRQPASGTAQDYCQAHDCQKSQKVIIKFNLKEE